MSIFCLELLLLYLASILFLFVILSVKKVPFLLINTILAGFMSIILPYTYPLIGYVFLLYMVLALSYSLLKYRFHYASTKYMNVPTRMYLIVLLMGVLHLLMILLFARNGNVLCKVLHILVTIILYSILVSLVSSYKQFLDNKQPDTTVKQ